MAIDTPTRTASARAMRPFGAAPEASAPESRRSMNSPAEASAARMTTKASAMTIFMAKDCSTASPAPTAREPAPRPHRRIAAIVAALLLVALTARLGLWQLDRAATKQALQARQAQRERLPALSGPELLQLAAQPERIGAQLQRRVVLHGRWVADATVFLDNRPMGGRVGFHVVTPLRLDDGRAVLVQRGWAPRDALRRERLPPVQTPDGTVTLSARLVDGPSRLYALGDGAPERGPIRQNLDSAALARDSGLSLLPLTLLQVDDAGNGGDGLRRDWPAPDFGIERHRGYALQWFALSTLAAGLLLWFALLRPWLRRRKAC